MPPKLRKGKKGKGKRKGKKKGKKKQIAPEPPPLHLLTELYKKLDDTTMELYEMRIATRRKRLETWFMMMQIAEQKVNNQVFREYIQDKMNDIQSLIDRFLKLIQEERDAINAAIQKILEDYNKQIQGYNEKSAALQEELDNVRMMLLDFEPMMKELERLLARLEEIKKLIEEAEIGAALKKRHLTNQFLHQRGRLHNHLEEQLCILIQRCRSYIMPILWNWMQRLIARNQCARWNLARVDETNIDLAEKREELIRRRKLLSLEKPYWNIDWALYKMSEDASAKKKINKVPVERKQTTIQILMIGKTDQEMTQLAVKGKASQFVNSAGTILGRDFNKFLIQRLTAATAAQERAQKSHKKIKKNFMETVLEVAAEERRMTMMSQVDGPLFFADNLLDHDDQWDELDWKEEDDEDEEDKNEDENEEEGEAFENEDQNEDKLYKEETETGQEEKTV